MNPVLQKDLLQTLRERRVAVVQTLFVVVLGVAVLMCWPEQGVLAVATRAHDDLFDTLMLGQIIFLLLFVPGAAATSLVSEIEAQTFEMLNATRLRPAQILLGKIGGATVFPILLLLTGLPFVGLLALRGASSLEDLIKVYATLLMTAIYLSTLALAVSSCFRTTSGALIAVYLIIMGLCVAPLVPAAILLDSSSGFVAAGFHYARAFSPIAAVLALLRPDWGDFDGHVHSFVSLWPANLALAGLATIGSALFLAFRLPRLGSDVEQTGSTEECDRPIWRRLLFRSGTSALRKPIATANPLLANEGRINAGRSGVWCARLFYLSVLTSMLMALISLYGGGGDRELLNHATQTVIAFQIGFIALITPVLTSAVISSERERGTFELLRMTPLRPGEIFFGKLIPALIPALLPIIAFLPAYATICFLDPGYISYFLALIPILALASIFCCTAGLVCSVFFGQSARATVAGYVVASCFFFGPVLIGWAAGQIFSQNISSWIAMPSPMFVALNLVNLDPDKASNAHLCSVHLIFGTLMVLAFLVAARIRLSVLLKQG